MTPAARIAAAIEILDVIAQGAAAEQALTRWARLSRFAGSKDRAAVRDHVFDVLRLRDTVAALGGGASGRALMLGLLRYNGLDPSAFFNGQGYAPAALSAQELAYSADRDTACGLWNLPDWLVPEFERSLGEEAGAIAQALTQRGPVTLRVNLKRADVTTAMHSLATDGVVTTANPVCATALTVTEGARRVRNATAFLSGQVEVQDAASQAVVDDLPEAQRCLDYCAGGGGKALAMAAQDGRRVFAHDRDPDRMRDIAPRAKRAGAVIKQLATDRLHAHGPFDLVLCDAPCSGSGAWRRSPEAKWRFTSARLQELQAMQQDILREAAPLVDAQGWLVYATCSVLRAENEDQITAFLSQNPDWRCTLQRRWPLSENCDGFYTAHLTRG
ncbi:RsmB/NOP family class I SAM-dependent RNA methyltransferase [Roseobacter denitrificans]|uniref:NOL1/NOP2/sun family protein, putative n=1 Tax=Roseobacter denitrificans (strain ATCC 33942 / OCh 114) TaxID=375451 RepID=Q165U2_ROSDO|nr:RsmB/NOP family class I SAM-dependent RNA methyltransferase [Roseobacter denitrificans]ABG32251.1 NOL1/NOP2/sun family protein, putative [Roseobacter denitrificans OCh 114]AVL51744.1 RsmB/NOP family class I SAM-dependent RNA methyltransferase [Roseobacter denitrificans]SFF79335.1 16S rRNA (cytosine967-C5)-methyltransferase [Roseobacter denitrificans OCh 114]